MPPHVYRPAKYKTCGSWSFAFAASVFFMIVSAIAFIVCGFVVARPGLPALQYEKTMCTALNYTYKGMRECECGGIADERTGCSSRFACIEVYVEYSVRSNNSGMDNMKFQAILHEHEATAYSIHSECSVYTCKSQKRANTYAVNSFQQKYGKTGKNFTCYYDKDHVNLAIVERNYSRIGIIVALAIPGGLFIVLFITVTILCKIKCSARKKPDPRPHVLRSYMNPSVVTHQNPVFYHPQRPPPGLSSSLTNLPNRPTNNIVSLGSAPPNTL